MLTLLYVCAAAAVSAPGAPAVPAARPFAATAPVRPAVAWGGLGHRLIARLALIRLTPETQAEVRRLLGDETLADISVWADQIRRERPATAPLHYVNLPRDAKKYKRSRDCAEDKCVVEAITHYRTLLADRRADSTARYEALKFLVHFVGDLHQPLHAGYGDDKGGNDVRLRFLGRDSNLHAVWDSGLLDAAGLSENQYLDRLRAIADTLDATRAARGSPASWANESNRLVRATVYEGVSDGAALDEGYFLRVTDVVDHQLVRAGLRLARLLEDALGPR